MPAGSILVADDDTAIRTVLNQALSRAGYEVRLTGNAATLWRWVSQGEGDLVITDVVMPDENAFDLLPRIKKMRPNLPVIVMSAQNTFMTAIRASERGAYEYLPKPFDLTTARSCLKLLSGRRHRVLSGIALVSPDERLTLRRVDSQVAFKRLSEAEIAAYLCSGEWHGKAGGYAIQGRAAALIRWVSGSYSSVVGLPLFETAQLLTGGGYRLPCQTSC